MLDERTVYRGTARLVADLGPERRVVLRQRVVAFRLEAWLRAARERVEEERLLHCRDERVSDAAEHRVVRPDDQLVLAARGQSSRTYCSRCPAAPGRQPARRPAQRRQPKRTCTAAGGGRPGRRGRRHGRSGTRGACPAWRRSPSAGRGCGRRTRRAVGCRAGAPGTNSSNPGVQNVFWQSTAKRQVRTASSRAGRIACRSAHDAASTARCVVVDAPDLGHARPGRSAAAAAVPLRLCQLRPADGRTGSDVGLLQRHRPDCPDVASAPHDLPHRLPPVEDGGS